MPKDDNRLNALDYAANRAENTSVGGAIGLVIAGITAIFTLRLLLIPFVALAFLIAWNLGLVGAAAAVGLTVTAVSYWTALGLVFLVRIVKSVLSSIGRLHINGGSSGK